MAQPPKRSRRARAALFAAALAALASSCDGGAAATLARRPAAVVSGRDDRVEVWQEPRPRFAALATNSTVALIDPAGLRFGADGQVAPAAAPLAAWDDYCPGTPFVDQPTAASCGGVLIDDDLIVTAAHCLDSVPSCRGYEYVFGYLASAPGTIGPYARGQLFGCRAVAVRVDSPPDAVEAVDFAVLQLDRAAGAGRRPVALASGDPAPGQALTVIGFPSGLPAKIDGGAVLVDARARLRDYFTLTSDTFAASSGGGVFDAAGDLLGVFARGSKDFVDRGPCRAVRTLAGDPSTSEEAATYAARAREALCAAGWPSLRLCGMAPACGDGVCSGGSEDAASCARDCPAASCGDLLCERAEWDSCPADCGDRRPPALPPAWTCTAV